MSEIKIRCTSGLTMSIEQMSIYNSRIKKHSILEVEMMIENIEKNGFNFPIAIGKLNGENYIIDGELRYLALDALNRRNYELPEIPIFYIRVKDENDLKERIIASSSTYHVITKTDYENMVKGTNIDLKNYCLPEGTLIDFYTVMDIDRWFEDVKNKDKNRLSNVNYVGLLKDEVI